jgi:peptide-methionine (R)-S-oxide reductase
MEWKTMTGLGMAALLGLAACAFAGSPDSSEDFVPTRPDAVVKTSDQWKAEMTAQEFHVLREKGTERAFTGEYWDHHGDGVYVCGGCGLPLYDSETKFESGTGWPSFYQAVDESNVATLSDTKFGMVRTELLCARCGGHLGHVFPDGPKPTGQRHCINSVSLDFVPRKKAEKMEEKADPAKE